MPLDHPKPLCLDGLSILNANPARLPGPCLLHELVSPASRDGLSAAVDFLSENGRRITLSYPDLHAASLALAYRISCVLRSAASAFTSTLETQDPLIIPILSPQSPQLYVALLAVLKVSGAFCPLNADAPTDRVRFILEDVKAKIVLVSRDLVSKLPADDETYRVIFIDDVLDGPDTKDDGFPSCHGLKPEDFAYVMYTSGSTGTPKGVAVSHLAATQSILAHERHIPSFSRFLQFAAPTFDVSVFEIFFPLFRGATLVGCNRAEMLTDLPGVLKRMEVDACELTPSVAGSLLRQRSRAPGLRLLLTIGEMLTDPVVREFGGNEHTMSILWGMYGPTEATIHCTVQTAFAATLGRNTIGIPFDTVSAFIIHIPTDANVSSNFEILPVGEVGELALGGLQLATCYLNRPDQTAASFVDTLWGQVYKTGDKAMIRPDGTIECLGRIDDSQVKLNGQRLELGEVEQVLLRTSVCHSAFAAIISNVLIAFAAVEQMSDSNTQLWRQCRSWLPAFMVPTDIVMMERLPQLPSGKVDRKRLIHDYMTRATTVARNEEASDDHERLLCEVATAILGQPVGPSTEFSAASLDSLAAIEYASILMEKGISITPINILSTKTPRELRQRIGDARTLASGPDSEHRSPRRHSDGPYLDKWILEPTLGDQIHQVDRLERPTHLQQSMIAETLKDTRLYINQVEFELPSHITLDVLHSSLKQLVEYNEILRTGFTFVKNQLCQVIWKQLDDAQICETYGNDLANEVKDAELFLLRPLRVEIRHLSPTAARFTLLLTLHHAIYDGWTIDLMIEDLSLLLSDGLPTKRPQFSQVVRHLHDSLEANNFDSMEFWTEHLHGAGAVSTSSFKTVAVSESQRAVAVTKIPLHPEALKNLMLRISVGPQVLFQACLVWLWAAVQGNEDSVIGCVSSGRSLPLARIDKIMGPCMTTLPLRINTSRFRTIVELLQNIHSTNREILRQGHVPLSEINKAAGISANSRLFDVIFAYQESPASRRQGLNIVRETWHCDATEAKLVIEIQPCGDHFICQTTTQTDFLSESLAEAFTRHLIYLIEYFANHVGAPIATIPQYFPFDSLSHFNEKPKCVETPCSLSEMVERSASRFSSAAALCFATSIDIPVVSSLSLSYHDLNSKANQIARHLQQCDIVSGDIIAIVMNKSPLLYCSILGILKTGCAYLPILPSTPAKRVRVILKQAEPCLCIVDTVSSSLMVGRESSNIINIETASLSSYSDSNLSIRSEPSDLAYVIYTSGTTGTPKGVAVTSKNILSNISVLSNIYPHGPSSRMLQACSQAFDVSVFEIFFAWANGMCLCAATNDTLFEDFERAVRALEITHLSLTVTVASLLHPENVPNVNFLVTSGEPMTDEVLDKWSRRLYQGYGPSETTNICTVRKVSKGDSSQFLGWSFENTSTFVLYPKSPHLVPVGCVGELCFGGEQVASGYLKLPEVTAASFIDHPSYGRLYRSGDLGRMLPDGSLLIHGRIDTQVKLRGLRIELLEVQASALTTGITRICRSILVTHESMKSQQLALFYVPFDHRASNFELLPFTDNAKEQVRTLWHRLGTCLPDYMVPTFIFPIAALPLTPSGKVDEGTLCSSVSELSASVLGAYSPTKEQADVQSDWSEAETLIATVITEILNRDRNEISRWTAFSALGIDSISAMPIARKLQSILRKRVPLSLLLQNPSVSRLASAITEVEDPERSGSFDDSQLSEELVEAMRKRFEAQGRLVAKVLPCTPLQEAMVMSSSTSSPTATEDRVAYYNQMLFHLRVPYEAIVGHWNEVVRRHDILRACFVTSDNIRHPAVQVILDDYVPKWQVFVTEGISLHERASQLVASASTTTNRDEPPMTLAIIRTQGSGEYLSFVCHHAMYDGISMRIMLGEIEALYQGRQLSEPPSLEPFLREMQLPSPNQDNFWKQLMMGFQPTPLRCGDFMKDPMPRSISMKASQFPLKVIESQLRGLGVSMLALCQTAWAVTLSILSQKGDVSFGNVVTGRSIQLDMIDSLVAPCFNTLPMRMDLSLSAFLMDVMKSFQSLSARMMLHQFTSLRRIQKYIDTQTRLFDTVVILQPQPTPLDDTLWSLVYEDGSMDIPIVCEIIPSGLQDTLTLQLHRDKSRLPFQALELIGNISSYVIDACLSYPSSHVPTGEILPHDWQQDIRRLFHPAENSQMPNGLLNPAPAYEEAWSPLELTVRQVLAKLVEMPEDQIERLTPIYQYGLDSITAIQLATLLRHENVFVSAIDVIEHPTCAGIAFAVKDLVQEDSFGGYDFDSFQRQVQREILESEVDFQTIETVLPCTATQQGLLLQFLDSEGRYYFNYSSWALDIAAEPDTISRAWVQLVNRHQILRTGFMPVNHPDSCFAMLVYQMAHVAAPVSIHRGSFDAEQWRLDAAADALHELARPPWRIAIVTPRTAKSGETLVVHLAIHHALYDAFTLRSLLQNLSEIISQANEPKTMNIEYALSHYFSLVRSNQSAGEAFWRQKANDFVAHKFPVMTPLNVDSSSALLVSHTCDTSSSILRQAASGAGITLQAAIQAAWTRLLSAYIGESRIIFGVVLDGRTTELSRKATLPMITTLPVMAKNLASNAELVQQMMQYNSDLRRFQFMPITQIQRCLGVTGPMFDTILIYQAADNSMKPPPVRPLREIGSVEYLISLEVEESSFNTTQLNLAFRASILPPEQAMLLLNQFEAILMDLLISVDTTRSSLVISRPDLFSVLPAEHGRLPTDAGLLHGLVEHSARLAPSNVALEFVEEITQDTKARIWTYRQLDDFGNQVAHFIIGHRVKPRSIIATCFNKCPVAYFTLLGILKAGCAFLCLDPSAPITRQKFILDDSNAAMLLLGESFDWAHDTTVPVYMVDEAMLASLPTRPPTLQHQISPFDSCYCLYTSGTTGTPKGCLISHENTVQAMAAFKHLFAGRWNADSRWLQFAAFHFDVSILEQYWSWNVGITVVAAPKDVILSDLAMTISKLRITHIDLTPSLARLINPDECPSLCRGIFITGGEKLRSDILETWGPKRVIYNAYGPTETTIGITMNRRVPQNGRPSNIGNLFPNVGAYIFERDSETPVLRGGIGELCVAGKLVGKGYLNREGLNKERFPMLQASGERIYRTGDLVRVLHDDSLDFLGRADDQVKLRGQRLEIGEINYTIREGLAGKADDVTTVVTRRRNQDTDLLVSFIAFSSNSNPSRELRIFYDTNHIKLAARAQEACRYRLSTYMVPSFIVCISRIPLSTNNKVDVSRLREIFSNLSHEQLQALSISSLQSDQPLDKLQSKVLEAFYQVVHVQGDDIGPTTTIFQLGLDSITVTRLAKQLRNMGFISATPSLILRHPQIGQLSQALNRPSSAAPSNNALQVKLSMKALQHQYLRTVCSALEVDATEVEYIAPCTPLQQGIIARSKAREAEFAYFNQFQLCLVSNLSIGLLKAALNRVIASYSVLRTAFVDTPDGYLQVAIRNWPLRWFEVAANMESFERTIAERRHRWIEANHHVLKWPVEVDHVEVGSQHYLLLRLFHAVYDAHSLEIILESLKSEYDGIPCSPGPAYLSVLPEGPLLDHQESHSFWRSSLENHRFEPMPSLVDAPSTICSVIHRSVRFEGLEERPKTLEVTHQALLQAAWLYTLRRYFINPPTIGVVLSGRSLAIDDIDLVVGPLFNTLPLRVDFTNDTSWVSLTRKIQEHNNGLLRFAHTPLRDIQKLCASGQPLFDTLFTFDRDYNSVAKDERTLWSIQQSPGHPDYPLAIEVIMIGDNILRITLAARGDIADEKALSSLLDQFIESLNSANASKNEVRLSPAAHTARLRINKHVSIPVAETSSSTSSDMSTSKNGFVWNENAYKIRHELAVLARVDERDISEATNFFALGLDSVDVINLAGRLAKLGCSVPIGTLMKQPTLESIITRLEEPLSPTTNFSSTAELDNIISILEDYYVRTGLDLPDVEAVLPPTPLQDSMVAEMVRSDFHTYFNHDVLEFPPDTNIDRLKTALSTVYANSPILRTGFVEIDDPRINSAYYQVVRKRELEFAPFLKISNMNGISEVTNLARLQALEGDGTSNLFQVHFAELKTKKLIVLSIAHALYDGWSLYMLHKDIQHAYDGTYIPRQSYKPYLSRMICQSSSAYLKFWADLLHGAHATPLPQVRTMPKHSMIHRIERISKKSAADIRTLCKNLHITPQVLGQGCWASVLASLVKSLDVVFGVVLSGRNTEQAQELMFPTMNTVPLRLALHGTVIQFLGYLQDIMSTVVGFQHTPLREVLKLSPSHEDKLFSTIFILQNSRDNQPGQDSFFKSIHSVSAVDYPLCVELELTGKDAIWRIACDNNYMLSRDVDNLGASLESVLDYFAQDFSAQVLDFNSQDSTTVSICGLEPVAFNTEAERQETDAPTNGHHAQGFLPPPPPGYETLLDVLSDLSKVGRQEIDLDLSIFHIGLDSISAIKASSMLRKRGLEISTRDLVTTSSIRGILEHANRTISKQTEDPKGNSLPFNSVISGKEMRTLIQRSGLNVDSVEKILPALPIQVHMLSVWQNNAGATFFPKFAFKVSGPIDLTTVSKAWVTLVDETAMLRTHLISTTSSTPPFLQAILKSKFTSKQAISIVTASHGRWEFVYAATPFAVVQFLGEGPGEASLQLYLHHALYDGVSLPIILDRFTELCGPTPLFAAPDHRAPWCGFAMKHLALSAKAQRESFWTSYLSGHKSTQLFKIHQLTTTTQGERVNEFQRTFIKKYARLKHKASIHGIPTQALLFAAYAKAFLKWLHRDGHLDDSTDCVFGIYLANRSGYPNIEEVPFPTLNILPLRVRDPLSRSITVVASEIQKDIAEISSLENSTASLWEIQRWTGVRIDTCVNILSHTNDDPLSSQLNSVTLKKISDHDLLVVKGVDVSTYLISPESESLSPNAVAQSYIEGVDIELALRDDVLDLGIFSSSSVLTATRAKDMITNIVAEIEAS
ncbi:amino acid adenylation domain-containing protein [Xylariaceae sp. AK1471]|nr:amino acid adenylation domain-containing protein [Xylariaceae sp. AK1471]